MCARVLGDAIAPGWACGGQRLITGVFITHFALGSEAVLEPRTQLNC